MSELDQVIIQKSWNVYKISKLNGLNIRELDRNLVSDLHSYLSDLFEKDVDKEELERRRLTKERVEASIATVPIQGMNGSCLDILTSVYLGTELENQENMPNHQKLKQASSQVLICSTTESLDTEAVDVETDSQVFNCSFLLIKGKTIVQKAIFHWIEHKFDCTIGSQALGIAPRNLAEIATRFSKGKGGSCTNVESLDHEEACAHSKEPQALEMEFTLPDSVSQSGLKKITIAIPPNSLNRLLESIDEPSNSGATMNMPQAFNESHDTHIKTALARGISLTHRADQSRLEESPLLTSIYSFIDEQLHIRLRGAMLTRIATPQVVVSSDGRVKILEQDALADVLLQLSILSKPESQNNE